MNLLKDFKITCSLFGLMFLLCSCSSAVFPEIVDEDGTESSMHESKYLASDEENIAYDDTVTAERITPTKVLPVVKGDDVKSKKMPEMIVADSVVPSENIRVEQENYLPSMTFLADTIYFDNGGSSVTGEHSASIRKVAKLAKEHNAIVSIYGYASSRTRNTDIVSHKLANFKVSAERAESVARALKRAGVPAKNIRTEALSDSNPAYQEVMPEGERLNRRAEIYVSY